MHAPAAVRKQARTDRLAGVQTVSARVKARRSTQLEMNGPAKLYDASKDIEKAMRVERVCRTLLPIHTSIFPTACLFYSLPFSDLVLFLFLFIDSSNSHHSRKEHSCLFVTLLMSHADIS
jgi:hypothetical protein